MKADEGTQKCIKCTPGYTSLEGTCVGRVFIEGCLMVDDGKCALCDTENGWFALNASKCIKILQAKIE